MSCLVLEIEFVEAKMEFSKEHLIQRFFSIMYEAAFNLNTPLKI